MMVSSNQQNEMYPAAENKGDFSKQGFLRKQCKKCGFDNLFSVDNIKANCRKCNASLTVNDPGETTTESR